MILVTGAAGHTGLYVVRGLRERFPGEPLRCLVRPSTETRELEPLGVEIVLGDLSNQEDVTRAVQGVSRVVHIANIRYSPTIARAALAAGVEQVVLVHTTGMYSRYRSYALEYQRIEQEVLNLLSGSSCKYSIVRPTMIYGGWRDHNIHKLIKVLSRLPVFPVFGNGRGKMQPVHVEDLAYSIVQSLDNPHAFNQAFNISGGTVHTYEEILNMVNRGLGRRVRIVHIPYFLALAGIWLLSLLRISPVSVEQVRRLTEDKVFEHDLANRLLHYQPRPLEQGLRQQIIAMGLGKAGTPHDTPLP